MDENSGEKKTEHLELWRRDVVECVRELLGNPAFKDDLKYVPEKLFGSSAGEENVRVFDEMWTGDWWWDLQVRGFCAMYYSGGV